MTLAKKQSSPAKAFKFTAATLKQADAVIAKYPEGKQQSALLPLLDLAQRQNKGHLTVETMNYIADYLSIAPIRVYEVASFYSMFNDKPVGEHFIQICRTTPCWLRGSDQITEQCKKQLGIGLGETTKDGKFTIKEVECLGACANAPMIQINDDYYEDLDAKSMEKMLQALEAGKAIVPGSQKKRICSMPEGGLTTLTDPLNAEEGTN